MPTPLEILRQRTRRLNDHSVAAERAYVLCWLQQALRGDDNPIIDAAVAAGNQHGLPVVVYHGLDNRYPYASHRLHRFILEASQSLGPAVEARGLRFCRYVRRPEKLEEGLVYRLCERAALLVTDDLPTYVAKWQAERVAARVEIPVLAVDASCLVPMNHFRHPTTVTKTFRAAHRPQRELHIAADLTQASEHGRYEGDLGFESDEIEALDAAGLDALIGHCEIDMSLPPAPDSWRGGREAALKLLDEGIEHTLPNYRYGRNNPADPHSTTKLSPHVHFGVIGPREIARRVLAADISRDNQYKFFDELMTWREFFHHLTRHQANPDALDSVPEWAYETLQAHAADERPVIYSEEELLHGETDDETWNAAQKQFLLDGWMHNNLRMYWVKQFIKWRPTPQDAWEMACRFNDRLSLDGRDPSTYGNIQWGFGHSKKAYRENPIYGWVPPKSDGPIRKRKGAKAWLAEQAKRPVPFRLDP